MGADAPQDIGIVVHLKREAIAFADPAFPDILGAFHFLDAQ